MKNQNFHYHLFLFLSTFTRGLVEVFSLVLLSKKGFEVNDLFLFLLIMYTFGILVNYVSLKINYKLVLIASSILFSGSFLFLSVVSNKLVHLIIFAILLSSSTYSIHAIRHYLALIMLKQKKTNIIVTIMYLGNIISNILSIIVIKHLPLIQTSIILGLLSLISLVPALKFKVPNHQLQTTSISQVKLPKEKILFNIFEQFKVIFLELQPLFLYLYIDNSISYIGTFNIIANIASLIVVYFLAKHINTKYFKYICLLLSGILFIKLNIKNQYILLSIALFEGILIKLYENISLENLYNLNNNSFTSYLIVEELIFFTTKSFILLLIVILKISLYTLMHICIIGIFISGFFIKSFINKEPLKIKNTL